MARIIPRSEWQAAYGNGKDASSSLPRGEVVVHTEAGALRPQDWTDLEGKEAELAAWRASAKELGKVRAVERFHAVDRGWDGIAYSFFVTFDGSIFEGRGWDRSGAHTEGRNFSAVGVCFEGHGDLEPPTPAQWAAVRWLIGEGIRLRKLKANPKISGHRAYSQKGKTCPGLLVTEKELDRLRGIMGPIEDHHEEEGFDMDEKTLRKIIREETNDIRGGVMVAIDEGRKNYGSLRGWLYAIASTLAPLAKTTIEKIRDLAHKNDPVGGPDA